MVGGAVQRTPYRAALALGVWGVDHWPYASGRALLSGARLGELDVSDTLDILHVLFEESQEAGSQEQLKAREHFRRSIYTSLYDYKAYEWVSSDNNSASGASSQTTGADMIPMDDTANPPKITLTHKPYVPPTPMNVDSPLPIAGLKEEPLG